MITTNLKLTFTALVCFIAGGVFVACMLFITTIKPLQTTNRETQATLAAKATYAINNDLGKTKAQKGNVVIDLTNSINVPPDSVQADTIKPGFFKRLFK